MTFTYKEDPSSDFYKLTIENVKKIAEMNKRGQKPESLVSLAIKEEKIAVEEKDEDLVGQIQLKTLEKKAKPNKKRNKNKNRNNSSSNNPPQV
jgi:hypothetical protein